MLKRLDSVDGRRS